MVRGKIVPTRIFLPAVTNRDVAAAVPCAPKYRPKTQDAHIGMNIDMKGDMPINTGHGESDRNDSNQNFGVEDSGPSMFHNTNKRQEDYAIRQASTLTLTQHPHAPHSQT